MFIDNDIRVIAKIVPRAALLLKTAGLSFANCASKLQFPDDISSFQSKLAALLEAPSQVSTVGPYQSVCNDLQMILEGQIETDFRIVLPLSSPPIEVLCHQSVL